MMDADTDDWITERPMACYLVALVVIALSALASAYWPLGWW